MLASLICVMNARFGVVRAKTVENLPVPHAISTQAVLARDVTIANACERKTCGNASCVAREVDDENRFVCIHQSEKKSNKRQKHLYDGPR